MSRVISFRDLRIIPALSRFNEVELLHPSNDHVVAKYLEMLGFNTAAPIEYIPNNHRDMQGNTGVGFRAVGTIDTNSDFLKTKLATMEDRIMATFFKDPSLARELAQMLNTGINFSDGEASSDDEDDFPEELIEPTYEEVTAEIAALVALRDSLRGESHNASGCPKTYAEVEAACLN